VVRQFDVLPGARKIAGTNGDLVPRLAWPEWRQMLAENFAVKRDLHRALQIMMDCKPKARQSLYEYTYEKLALIHKLKLPISGADQVNLIMGGINDKQIRFTVEAAGIKSPSELAKHFRNFV
jgi:hypothetical protein